MLPAIARKSVTGGLPFRLAQFEMEATQALGGGSPSAVFATPLRVLRLIRTLRREQAFIRAELHFTRSLAEHGLAVAYPLPVPVQRPADAGNDPESGSGLVECT